MIRHEDDLHPAQIAAFGRMTPGERLDAAVEMIHAARRLQASALGVMHPDWTEEQIAAEVRRRWLHKEES